VPFALVEFGALAHLDTATKRHSAAADSALGLNAQTIPNPLRAPVAAKAIEDTAPLCFILACGVLCVLANIPPNNMSGYWRRQVIDNSETPKLDDVG